MPKAQRFRLEKHEIAQVICQVQFSPVLRITRSDDGVVPFQEAIRQAYPRYSKQQPMNIVVGPDGVQQQVAHEFQHRFADTDARYTATLASDFVALATARYVDIDDFAERIGVLTSAVAELYAPPEMTRLGLRFINEFRLGTTAPRLRMVEILNQGFLGASGAEELRDSLVASQHVLHLAGEDRVIIARHGLNPQGGTTVVEGLANEPGGRLQEPFYLLDIDVFAESIVPFSVDDIGATMRDFNEQVRSFFAWAVREPYRREHLGQVDL